MSGETGTQKNDCRSFRLHKNKMAAAAAAASHILVAPYHAAQQLACRYCIFIRSFRHVNVKGIISVKIKDYKYIPRPAIGPAS